MLRIRRISEYSLSTISGDPSADPLSTTRISRSVQVWLSREFRQFRSKSRRFQVTTMTETLKTLASAHVIIQLASGMWRSNDLHRRKTAPPASPKADQHRE